MAWEYRELQGSLFKNNRKAKDSDPDISGRCLVGGKMYMMWGRRKVKKDGEGWYQVSFGEIDDAHQPSPPHEGVDTPQPQTDDMPF